MSLSRVATVTMMIAKRAMMMALLAVVLMAMALLRDRIVACVCGAATFASEMLTAMNREIPEPIP